MDIEIVHEKAFIQTAHSKYKRIDENNKRYECAPVYYTYGGEDGYVSSRVFEVEQDESGDEYWAGRTKMCGREDKCLGGKVDFYG